MQSITRLFFASALAVTSSLALADDMDQQVRQQWHQAIQAGYQSLSDETRELSEAARQFCISPADESRERLEGKWLDSFLTWQQIRFVDFGPVENNNLSWQFQFWPDPKNLIARKAKYLLSADGTISPETVRQSGVAVQGFPMMEYLLFDQQLNTGEQALPSPRTCELLTSVARHIATNSQKLAGNWQAFWPHYLETEPYRDATIRAGMTALEILEERRLAQPMGLRGNGNRNPYQADAWRSGKSLMTIEATAAGLEQYFLPGLVSLLEANGQTRLADRIRNQFAEVLANFPGAHLPMVAALGNDDSYRVLQSLYVDVSQLATLVNNEAAVAIGVVRGFNSSDGD
ncbi:hypothetical protein BKP64_01625 [Marinobacter salinus]|uniref:Imelysin-like domain-containing protein n=1 Tax=Marinobacter salinus TaxID=1874317 RepID=A0A1D9GHX4_9GAMM|nr:imelysin family protein [Marinobacter salinus]AOY86980.1 hypothetical protein BKP64_01625 [Marinobacter salinus]